MMTMLPRWKWIAQLYPTVRFEAAFVTDQTSVEHVANIMFGEIYADEDDFLPAITPDAAPMVVKQTTELCMRRP